MIPNVDLYLLPIQDKKICADCKFFVSNKKECSKFGDVNIITGKYDYEDAISVRNDETKCGEDAIFFRKQYFKIMYIPFEFLKENSEFFFLLGNACVSFGFLLTLVYIYISIIN